MGRFSIKRFSNKERRDLMKLELNTADFKEMMSKVIKGASNSNDYEITRLMAISLDDGELTLTTTDYENYLYVRRDKVVGDNFYAVVSVDKFSKLISKTTSEKITLELKQSDKGKLDYLEIHGNGVYKMELPYDVDGELVEFPDPIEEMGILEEESVATIDLTTLHTVLSTVKIGRASCRERV